MNILTFFDNAQLTTLVFAPINRLNTKKNENIQIKEDKDEVLKNSERKGKKWKQGQGVKWEKL